MDINIPIINGLKVIQLSRIKHPDAAFVIVSGYDDFSYCRADEPEKQEERAINGITRYLQEHLEEEVSLSVLAEEFHLSAHCIGCNYCWLKKVPLLKYMQFPTVIHGM